MLAGTTRYPADPNWKSGQNFRAVAGPVSADMRGSIRDRCVFVRDAVVATFSIGRECIPFRLRRRFRTGRILVHGDGVRVHRVRLHRRLAEELLCSAAFGRKQEVDGLAASINGSIQVDPASLDLHVRLIHTSGTVAHAQMRPDPLLLAVKPDFNLLSSVSGKRIEIFRGAQREDDRFRAR